MFRGVGGECVCSGWGRLGIDLDIKCFGESGRRVLFLGFMEGYFLFLICR